MDLWTTRDFLATFRHVWSPLILTWYTYSRKLVEASNIVYRLSSSIFKRLFHLKAFSRNKNYHFTYAFTRTSGTSSITRCSIVSDLGNVPPLTWITLPLIWSEWWPILLSEKKILKNWKKIFKNNTDTTSFRTLTQRPLTMQKVTTHCTLKFTWNFTKNLPQVFEKFVAE